MLPDPDIQSMMMDPALKVAMALCVLLTGALAAMFFRQGPTGTVIPNAAVELELAHCRAESEASTTPSKGPGRRSATRRAAPPTPPPERPATVVTPLDRNDPPPALAPGYPESEQPATSRWGLSMVMMLPVVATTDGEAHSHKIVDGDTLASLAARYLGSAARADEIYQANREVLPDPKLLPIGVELKLPSRAARPAPASSPSTASPPLVPVH